MKDSSATASRQDGERGASQLKLAVGDLQHVPWPEPIEYWALRELAGGQLYAAPLKQQKGLQGGYG